MQLNSTLNNVSEIQGQSRSNMSIEPRNVSIDYEDISSPFFFENNAPISAMWAALSSTFPLGEKEFINSVMLFKDQITDKKLLQEVNDFATQEANHSVQHRKVNKFFESLGYDIPSVEKFIGDKIQDRVENWTPAQRLARTVAAEHVTATMAHFALKHPHTMDAMPESFRNLFRWHAIEEIEHKSVAFDVYKHCVGDMKALRRQYRYFAYYEFPLNVRGITKFLLKRLNHKSSRLERKQMWSYLFGKHGMIRSVRHLYWMFTKKDFHPWDHDDSELVADWTERLSPMLSANQKQ